MNELFRASGLPDGWRGYVMETVARQPWLAMLFHNELESVEARGMTKDEAVEKAVGKIPSS
jgi:hypothetical protein